MMVEQFAPARLQPLHAAFSGRVRLNEPLARYTAARVGGPAAALLEVGSADELAHVSQLLWEHELPFLILGGGSNVLVSDAGVNQVVILNHARRVEFEAAAKPPVVWAESGANFGLIARQAGSRGLAGLEWAGGIPGTLGGAVFGNAGAHGGDMAGNLILAEILHRNEAGTMVTRENWPVERLGYAYRSSILKREAAKKNNASPFTVILSAQLRLAPSTPQAVQERMDEWVAFRRKTQPPGASMGSMFKNPEGDYAGRLIEAAGLKGTRVGGAEISSLHANFFINTGSATATDIDGLLRLARAAVAEKFGVHLELEIERVGEWREE